jgi:hypothetical protein
MLEGNHHAYWGSWRHFLAGCRFGYEVLVRTILDLVGLRFVVGYSMRRKRGCIKSIAFFNRCWREYVLFGTRLDSSSVFVLQLFLRCVFSLIQHLGGWFFAPKRVVRNSGEMLCGSGKMQDINKKWTLH